MGKKLGSCLDGEKNGAPGPGNYNTQTNNKKVTGGVFGVKFVTSGSRMESNVGPGQYEVASSFGKKRPQSARCTFGSSRTKAKPVLEVPGPGQYSIDESAAKSGFGFGTSKRSGLRVGKDEVPGPGQYNQKVRSSTQGCTIRARHGSSLVSGNKEDPGPGQYNPDIRAARPDSAGTRMGSSKRPDLGGKINDFPGPGQHSFYEKKSTAGNAFGKGQRSKLGAGGKENEPGPGNYNTKSTIGNQGCSILGGKLKANGPLKKSDDPGPGQYNLHYNTASGPSAKIGSEPR